MHGSGAVAISGVAGESGIREDRWGRHTLHISPDALARSSPTAWDFYRVPYPVT